MKIKKHLIEGVPLVYPVGVDSAIPGKLSDFDSSCGAGEDFGDIIIPETPLTVRFTPACLSHDMCWNIWDKSPKSFLFGNEVFLVNLESLIFNLESIKWIQEANMIFANLYYSVVSGPIGLNIWRYSYNLAWELLQDRPKETNILNLQHSLKEFIHNENKEYFSWFDNDDII